MAWGEEWGVPRGHEDIWENGWLTSPDEAEQRMIDEDIADDYREQWESSLGRTLSRVEEVVLRTEVGRIGRERRGKEMKRDGVEEGR